MTRVLLVGYGKMGKLIAKLAPDFDITIASIVDRDIQTNELPKDAKIFSQLVPEAINGCDVAIDFAEAGDILSRISLFAKCSCPAVIGTTGWDKQEYEAKQIIAASDIGLISAPNFSLGVSLFLQLAGAAAKLFTNFPQYDVGMHEMHHRQKQDAPSGTAKLLATKVLSHYPKRERMETTPVDHALASNAIHSSSFRVGFVPGMHELMFDSLEDTITLTHTARNREGFAKGALTAAHWIISKKGWFTLDDLIIDKLKGHTC
jgi:4-hydroxy-tetrahydrodipicolinate reductase